MSSAVIGAVVAALILTGDKTVDVYFTEAPPTGETSIWVCAYDGDAIMRCGTIDQFIEHMESKEKSPAPSPRIIPPRSPVEEL